MPKRQQVNPLNILNRLRRNRQRSRDPAQALRRRNRTFWVFTAKPQPAPDHAGHPLQRPHAGEQRGDFSELLRIGANYQIYDPATTTAAGSGATRAAFPRQYHPTARLDKTATGLLKYWKPAECRRHRRRSQQSRTSANPGKPPEEHRGESGPQLQRSAPLVHPL